MLMRFCLLSSCSFLLFSCAQPQHTHIIDVVDMPLRTNDLPSINSWGEAPLRTHAQYLMYNANSEKEQKECIGDYYFVNWYDAQPEKKVEIIIDYMQQSSGSKLLQRKVVFDNPRKEAKERQTEFFFRGKERAQRGDVLSWKISLLLDGKVIDSSQSYLWE